MPSCGLSAPDDASTKGLRPNNSQNKHPLTAAKSPRNTDRN